MSVRRIADQNQESNFVVLDQDGFIVGHFETMEEALSFIGK